MQNYANIFLIFLIFRLFCTKWSIYFWNLFSKTFRKTQLKITLSNFMRCFFNVYFSPKKRKIWRTKISLWFCGKRKNKEKGENFHLVLYFLMNIFSHLNEGETVIYFHHQVSILSELFMFRVLSVKFLFIFSPLKNVFLYHYDDNDDVYLSDDLKIRQNDSSGD